MRFCLLSVELSMRGLEWELCCIIYGHIGISSDIYHAIFRCRTHNETKSMNLCARDNL